MPDRRTVQTHTPPAVAETAEQKTRREFAVMLKDFGAAIASEVFADGGTYADAKDKHAAASLQEENLRLKEAIQKRQEGRLSRGTPKEEDDEDDIEDGRRADDIVPRSAGITPSDITNAIRVIGGRIPERTMDQ